MSRFTMSPRHTPPFASLRAVPRSHHKFTVLQRGDSCGFARLNRVIQAATEIATTASSERTQGVYHHRQMFTSTEHGASRKSGLAKRRDDSVAPKAPAAPLNDNHTALHRSSSSARSARAFVNSRGGRRAARTLQELVSPLSARKSQKGCRK